MPTVPRLTGPQVGTAPLPGVRVSGDAPVSAFGVPAAPDLSGVQRVAASIWEQERQKADELAVLEADNHLAKLETDLRTQALQRRGKDALGANEEMTTVWEKSVSEIDKGLRNDRQRFAFQRRVGARYQSLYDSVERHAAGEARAFDEEQTKAALQNRLNDAVTNYGDPDKVQAAVAETRALANDYARRNGLPPEAREQLLTQYTSQIHAGVIGRMLAVGDDRRASEYYASVKEQISGADASRVEQALEEGSTRGESQRRADAIVAKATTRGAALEEARKIDDPKLRDATVERVNRYFSEQKQAEAERRDELYLRAARLVDQNRGKPARDVVPPGLWAQLTPSHWEALARMADEPTENDDVAWLNFLALKPDAIAKLSRSEFDTAYWSKFDRAHRSRAESLWLSARDAYEKGQGERDPKLSSTITFKDRVDNTLKTAGLIPANKTPAKWSKDEAKFYAAFEGEAARRVEEFELSELGGKRKATGDEVQRIVDDLVTRRVFLDRFGRDPEKPTAFVTADEAGQAYVPYDQVPIAERNDLEARAEATGRKASRSQIEKAYGALLMNDPARALEILGLKKGGR